MSELEPKPPSPTPEQVVEELERLDHAARTIEEVSSMSPEAHERELAEAGYTEGDLAKLLGRIRGADAPAPPAEKPAAARARRTWSRMDVVSGWGMVAVAAAAILYLWTRKDKDTDRNLASDAGIMIVDGATTVMDVAKRLRAEAASLCEAGRYDECRAKLDEARTNDPKGDESDAVRAMRARIQGGPASETGEPAPVKPPPPNTPRINHAGDRAPGDKGPGNTAPNDKGPGTTAPNDKGPGNTAPNDKAPGGRPSDK